MSEELKERLKKLYEETICKVKIERKIYNGAFWTARGVRQGCSFSAKPFTMMLADLNERLEKRGKGGVGIGRKRLYVLPYADDVLLVARKEGGLKLMTEEFKKYVKEKTKN